MDFMSIGYSIFAIIVVLSILVFIHELGHFLAAKAFGVRVERFSIGFPPRLFGKQVGETDYCISATPLGGYVKLSGMVDESVDTEKMNEPPKPYEFRAKPTWQQAIIITAGVIMNFLLAIVILGGMFWFQGEAIDQTTTVGYVASGGIADSIGIQKYDKIVEINGQKPQTWQEVHRYFVDNLGNDTHVEIERNGEKIAFDLSWENLKLNDIERLGIWPLQEAKIGELADDFPAKAAGLQKGDKILAIGDSTITGWSDMTRIISENPGKPLQFTIQRGGETLNKTIIPKEVAYKDEDGAEKKRGVVGISLYREVREVAFIPAIEKGFSQAISFGYLNIKGFTRILSGKDSAQESLAGPIRIAKMAGDIAQQDFFGLFTLIAYLSVVLAIINILPVPALDGGHLVIILVEGIRRKPLPLRAKVMIQQVGMAILLMLIMFVIYNDIIHL